MTIIEIPILIAKKDCPIANKILSEVIFEKSGCKKNFTPSIALSSVNERIIRATNKTNNAGNIYLLAFSIPFCTPFDTTHIVMNIKAKCPIIAQAGFPIVSVNNVP